MSAESKYNTCWTTTNQEFIVYHYVNMGLHLWHHTEISLSKLNAICHFSLFIYLFL